MRKRLLTGIAAILLIASAILVLWQLARFQPDSDLTLVFFGLSLLIFLLMVTLGFMLVRFIVKLWVERPATASAPASAPNCSRARSRSASCQSCSWCCSTTTS